MLGASPPAEATEWTVPQLAFAAVGAFALVVALVAGAAVARKKGCCDKEREAAEPLHGSSYSAGYQYLPSSMPGAIPTGHSWTADTLPATIVRLPSDMSFEEGRHGPIDAFTGVVGARPVPLSSPQASRDSSLVYE